MDRKEYDLEFDLKESCNYLVLLPSTSVKSSRTSFALKLQLALLLSWSNFNILYSICEVGFKSKFFNISSIPFNLQYEGVLF